MQVFMEFSHAGNCGQEFGQVVEHIQEEEAVRPWRCAWPALLERWAMWLAALVKSHACSQRMG
jgi:hypothetical protein